MKDLWEELKQEIMGSDREDIRDIASIIRNELEEIELEGASYPELLENQNNNSFGADK